MEKPEYPATRQSDPGHRPSSGPDNQEGPSMAVVTPKRGMQTPPDVLVTFSILDGNIFEPFLKAAAIGKNAIGKYEAQEEYWRNTSLTWPTTGNRTLRLTVEVLSGASRTEKHISDFLAPFSNETKCPRVVPGSEWTAAPGNRGTNEHLFQRKSTSDFACPVIGIVWNPAKHACQGVRWYRDTVPDDGQAFDTTVDLTVELDPTDTPRSSGYRLGQNLFP